MADTAYTYGVARIRAKETKLLSDVDIEHLLACKSFEAVLALLRERGWGNKEAQENAGDMLAFERMKAWQEVRDLLNDEKLFSVLTIPKQYHNLKAAIKQVCTRDMAGNVYYDDVGFSPKELREMVEKRDFIRLPDKMAEVAAEATEALLQTQDGQLCDVIIDRMTLEEIKKAGAESGSGFIKKYADEIVAVANIRIAIRSAKTKKSKSFMERAMVTCENVSKGELIESAGKGVDEVCEYLKNAGFAEAAESATESPSAFERWCDNRIMDTIRTQKYNSFSAGPILAYVLARENEIKNVQIILAGKSNNLSDDFIRERIRKMYV